MGPTNANTDSNTTNNAAGSGGNGLAAAVNNSEDATSGADVARAAQTASSQDSPATPGKARRRGWWIATAIGALIVACGLGVAAGHWLVPPPKLSSTARVAPRSYQLHENVETNTIFRLSTRERLVALTFDDGPDPRWTPEILRILEKHGARATFFQIGSAVEKHPELTRQLSAAGMEIGVHEWKHKDVTQQKFNSYEERFNRTMRAIETAGAPRPTLFRPPYGRLDSPALFVSATHGMTNVLWSDHLTGNDSRAHAEHIVKTASPGMIILAHDGRSDPNAQMCASLDWMIGQLKAQGYRFVTVSELIAAARR